MKPHARQSAINNHVVCECCPVTSINSEALEVNKREKCSHPAPYPVHLRLSDLLWVQIDMQDTNRVKVNAFSYKGHFLHYSGYTLHMATTSAIRTEHLARSITQH